MPIIIIFSILLSLWEYSQITSLELYPVPPPECLEDQQFRFICFILFLYIHHIVLLELKKYISEGSIFSFQKIIRRIALLLGYVSQVVNLKMLTPLSLSLSQSVYVWLFQDVEVWSKNGN